MNFLLQSFDFTIFYNMITEVFDILGYNYYKGLKGKLPPIRYINLQNGSDVVTFAHPKDYVSELELFKKIYNNVINKNLDKILLDEKK